LNEDKNRNSFKTHKSKLVYPTECLYSLHVCRYESWNSYLLMCFNRRALVLLRVVLYNRIIVVLLQLQVVYSGWIVISCCGAM